MEFLFNLSKIQTKTLRVLGITGVGLVLLTLMAVLCWTCHDNSNSDISDKNASISNGSRSGGLQLPATSFTAEELLWLYGYLDCMPALGERRYSLVPILPEDAAAQLPAQISKGWHLDWGRMGEAEKRRPGTVSEKITKKLENSASSTDDEKKPDICSSRQVRQGLLRFQRSYAAPTTGRLDPSTLHLLASPRCGNPDTASTAPPTAPDSTPATVPASTPATGSASPPATALSSTLVVTAAADPGSFSRTLPAKRGRCSEPGILRTAEGRRKDKGIGDGKHDDTNSVEMNINDTKESVLLEISNQVYGPNDGLFIEETNGTPWNDGQQMVEVFTSDEEVVARRQAWLVAEGRRLKAPAPLPTPLFSALLRHGGPAVLRQRRSVFVSTGHVLKKPVISWRLVRPSRRLGAPLTRAAVTLAFRIWAEVIPRVFVEVTEHDVPVDVLVGFNSGPHPGCSRSFDGAGGQLGHAVRGKRGAEIHMDDDDPFSLYPDQGTSILQVAVHEVGHVLGLSHVLRNYSVMYAIYSQVRGDLELDTEDRRLVQTLYGHCSGRFATVLDLVTRHPDDSLAYTTFFFRGDHYWMYQNSRNRSRPGDPLRTRLGWPGLPDTPDAFVHIWTRERNLHIFFEGPYYYLYDPVLERVADGFPRKISRDFRSPETSSRRVIRTARHKKKQADRMPAHLPARIDTAFFDKRDENLYVFKRSTVYGYNVSAGGEGCCLSGYPRPLRQEFRQLQPDRPVPTRLDAVYYSYHHRALYLIRGKQYWHVISYHPLDRSRTNLIIGPYLVRTRWPDICDTDLSVPPERD